MNINRSQAIAIFSVAMGAPIDARLDLVEGSSGVHVISHSPSAPAFDNVWLIGPDGSRSAHRAPPVLDLAAEDS